MQHLKLRVYNYLTHLADVALQDLSASKTFVEDSQNILKYLFFLASVHRDELIVQCCVELLLEFNSRWEVNHKFLLAVFQNWGKIAHSFLFF